MFTIESTKKSIQPSKKHQLSYNLSESSKYQNINSIKLKCM